MKLVADCGNFLSFLVQIHSASMVAWKVAMIKKTSTYWKPIPTVEHKEHVFHCRSSWEILGAGTLQEPFLSSGPLDGHVSTSAKVIGVTVLTVMLPWWAAKNSITPKTTRKEDEGPWRPTALWDVQEFLPMWKLILPIYYCKLYMCVHRVCW